MDEHEFDINGNNTDTPIDDHFEGESEQESKDINEEAAGNKYDSVYRADYSYMDSKPAKKAKKEKKQREKKVREKKKGGFFGKLLACILCGVIFGACAAGSFYAVNTYIIGEDTAATDTLTDVDGLKQDVANLQKAILTTSTTDTANTTTTVVTDVTNVVEKVMPSMVAVTNTYTYTQSDWFGRTYSSEQESCGSGIIVGESDTEYFIATNHHVIEDAKSLTVTFVDETVANAYVKGYDASMDIAVIGVSKESLENSTKNSIAVAEIGDSENLKIGEPAIAIGNALGYGQSVTTGVVSALHREMNIDSVTYSDLIQTSAAINPGNSGGALLDINGKLIGINSSKIGGSTVEGMGFAIPIDAVRDIIQEFSDRETRLKVADSEKGYLGVTINSQIDPTQYGYPAGAVVNEVSAGSGAEAAGIYKYDVITKLNGQTVASFTELSECLSYYKVGETVTVTVARVEAGEVKYLELEVTLSQRSQ